MNATSSVGLSDAFADRLESRLRSLIHDVGCGEADISRENDELDGELLKVVPRKPEAASIEFLVNRTLTIFIADSAVHELWKIPRSATLDELEQAALLEAEICAAAVIGGGFSDETWFRGGHPSSVRWTLDLDDGAIRHGGDLVVGRRWRRPARKRRFAPYC